MPPSPSPPRWKSFNPHLSPSKSSRHASPTSSGRGSPTPSAVDVSDAAAEATYKDEISPRGASLLARWETLKFAIVRAEPLLTSQKVSTLPAGTQLHVVNTHRLPDGTRRVQVVLVDQTVPLGWLTVRRAEKLGEGARSKAVEVLRQVSREEQRERVEAAAEAARQAAEEEARRAKAAEEARIKAEAPILTLASLKEVAFKELPRVIDIWRSLDEDKSGSALLAP